MLKELLCLAVALVATTTVQGTGEFVVLHSPDSVEFTVNGEIEQSSLKEILSAALGYTSKQKNSDHNIAILDPFSLPKALVAIAIDNVEQLPFSSSGYPLIVDEVEETTWQAIRSRMEERANDNMLVRVNLSDDIDALGQSALAEVKHVQNLRALSLEVDEDRKFVEEMRLLHAIADKTSTANTPDEKRDIYWIVVSGLKGIVDLYGRNSKQYNEAALLMNNALNYVSNAFNKAYDGKAIIIAMTSDASQVRHSRSILLDRQRRDANASKIVNLAKTYNEDYPVIFNIILWFGVAFFFALLAVCIAIADMDPGRDSIIYRMTSNRMKKDN